MTKLATFSAIAGTLFLGAVTDADAWSRSGSFTGPGGSAGVTASGSCENGSCSRSVTRQSLASCADGVCTGRRQTTGPRGATLYRQGAFYR